MGASLLIPVVPKLIATLSGGSLAGASIYGGELAAIFAVIQFIAAPVLGNLSDRYGRRPVLLLSMAAFGLNYLVMGFARSIAWLFLSQAFAGLFGATLATAGAYVADITPGPERAHRFGMIGAANGVGFILGPMIGGILSSYGLRVPFFAAAAIALLNVIYGMLVLPESLPAENRRPFALARAHVLGAFGVLRAIPGVSILLVSILLLRLSLQTLPATWPYFAMQKFDWTPRMVGYTLGMYGAMSIVGQGMLVSRLSRWVGSRGCVAFGLTMAIVGFLGFAFAGSGWLALCFVIPSALGYMSGPTMTGMLSLMVPAERQGELQGALASLVNLSLMVTPPVMTRLYDYYATGEAGVIFPGAPYVAAAALAIGALVLFWPASRAIRPVGQAARN